MKYNSHFSDSKRETQRFIAISERCRCLSVCAGLYNTRRSSSSCTFQGGHRPQNYEHHVTQGDNRPHAQHDAVTTGIYIYKHC